MKKIKIAMLNPAITHNVFIGWRYFFDKYFDFTYYTHATTDDTYGKIKALPVKKLIRIFRNFIVFYDLKNIRTMHSDVKIIWDIFTNTLSYALRDNNSVYYSEFFDYKKWCVKKFIFYILWLIFFRNKKFILPTELAKKTFQKISWDVYYLPILYHGKISQKEEKNENIIRLLFVWRLSQKYKNIDFIIDNFLDIQKNQKNINLTLVGEIFDTKYEWKFRELENNGVSYIGKKNTEELEILYRESDVVVLVSDSDPIGAVVLEWMARSNAIIVSDTSWASCYVEDGGNGRIIKTNDGVSFQKAISELANDMKLLEKFQKNSYNLIEKKYWTWNKKILEEYYNWLNSFLHKRT